MTTSRSRRTPTAQPRETRAAATADDALGLVVAVTGAGSVLGPVVVAALAADPGVTDVRAIDAGLDGDAVAVDVTDPGVAAHLEGVDVIVHVGLDLDPDADAADRSARHVRGTRTVVTAAAAAGVRRVVLVTSAMVYGARPDNPVPLDEDAPVAAVRTGLLADLMEMEEVAAASRGVHRDVIVTVVRPAALVGPGVDTILTRHFASPRLLAVRDAGTRWQFCHVDDLASALVVAARGEVAPEGGVVTVASPGSLDVDEVVLISGLRRVVVPAGVAFGAAERLHRSGIVPAPAAELAYVVYPWVVPSSRLTEAGWTAAWDNAACLRTLMDGVAGATAVGGRRLGARDATLAGAGAAGATVAVLGAAAFVRRARRARGL